MSCDCSKEPDSQCEICSVDLYQSILKDQSICLNEKNANSFKSIIRPNIFLSNPNDNICESDCDGELIINVVFNGTVKLTNIMINTIFGNEPSEIKV